MVETAQIKTTSRVAARFSLSRAAVTRALAACAVVVATLAVAAPSWAGPVTGC